MIYELKKYVPHAGKSKALKDRFEAVTLPIFAKVGIKVLYCFEDPKEPEALYYVTGFTDGAERDAAWQRFSVDAEWKAAKTASETEGPLLASQSSTELHPTRYSPTGA